MLAALGLPEYPSRGFVERGLDLVFPPTCVGCRRIGRWICERCWHEVHWLGECRCTLCGRVWPDAACASCAGSSSALEGAIAAAMFEGHAREAVHALKFQGRHAVGGMMGKLMATRVPDGAGTMIVPVPLHPKRRRERGYDQSAILARHVSRALDIPSDAAAMRRLRPTRQQAMLSSDARRENVAGAFEAERWVDGERILLIDDVMTTGATLESAAGALLAAGAASVTGLVFAWAPPMAASPDTV